MFKPKRLSLFTSVGIALMLTACQPTEPVVKVDTAALQKVVSERTEDQRARDVSRHPVETIAFFQIEPGMSVAEALPGGGWYSNILANYLGSEGKLYGINYDDDMWARFGFFDEEGIKRRIAATKEFPNLVKGFTDNGITADGFTFSTAPKALDGTVDRVLFVRALHNLNRFEKDAETLTTSIKTAHRLLKDNGLVGVVQHQISEDAPAAGADGSRGYLKLSDLKRAFEKGGFELVDSSDINANPKDVPSNSDIVWRLPPSYIGTGNDPEKKQAVDAIGESNRMTLLFKKAQ